MSVIRFLVHYLPRPSVGPITKAVTDTAALGLVEATASSRTFDLSDILAVRAAEPLDETITNTEGETTPLRLLEALGRDILIADLVSLGLGESASVSVDAGTVTVTVTDSAAVQALDAGTVLLTLTVADSMAVQAMEPLDETITDTGGGDRLPIGIIEVATPSVTITVTDPL